MPWLATEGSSFFPVVVAIGFLWLSLALGRRLLILLGARSAAFPYEQGVIAAAVGAGVLQFVPLALGALGLLSTTNIRVFIAAIVLAAAVDLRAVAIKVVAAMRRETRPSFWMTAWLIALVPALLMAGLAALAPTFDFDGLTYHLTAPKRWMETGWLNYLPTYYPTNAPMGMSMLFAVGMAFAGDIAAKCFHYVLGVVVAAPALYLAGKRLGGPITGAVSATLYLVGPWGTPALLGSAYTEGAAVAAAATSALSWLIWFRTGHRGYLRSSALLAGMGVSFKLAMLLFPIALLALTAVAIAAKARDEQNRARLIDLTTSGLLSTASLVPLVAVPILPWFTRAFLLTGNPLFPVLANLIPTRDFSAELATQIDRFNRYMTWANTLGSDWTIEQRMWVLLGVAALLVLVGLLAFFRFRSWTARGAVVVLTITGLLQLYSAGLYLRYWLPLAAVLTVPIAAAFAPVLSRRTVMLAWIGFTLAGSLLHAYRIYLDLGANSARLLRTVAGLDDRLDFLRSRIPPYPLYEHANRELPVGAGIMLSGYCGGFYLDRKTFCSEFVQDSLRFTNCQDLTKDLRRLGITHVIAPTAWAAERPPPASELPRWGSYLRPEQYRLVGQLLTSSRTLAIASDQGLYEIAPTLLAKSSSLCEPRS
jgi:hypothetical protein